MQQGGRLLARAEHLMAGEYDPLLLLALAMDDDTLRTHTLYGARLLELLAPLLPEHRQLLLAEARAMAEDPQGPLCKEVLRRVVGMTREPACDSNAKKDRLFEAFAEGPLKKEGRRMAYPTLLQAHLHPFCCSDSDPFLV